VFISISNQNTRMLSIFKIFSILFLFLIAHSIGHAQNKNFLRFEVGYLNYSYDKLPLYDQYDDNELFETRLLNAGFTTSFAYGHFFNDSPWYFTFGTKIDHVGWSHSMWHLQTAPCNTCGSYLDTILYTGTELFFNQSLALGYLFPINDKFSFRASVGPEFMLVSLRHENSVGSIPYYGYVHGSNGKASLRYYPHPMILKTNLKLAGSYSLSEKMSVIVAIGYSKNLYSNTDRVYDKGIRLSLGIDMGL